MSELTDIKKGLLIKYNGDPYVVMEAKFLKESQELDLIFYEDNIIGVQLPPKVVLKVISAPPGIKGDTVSGSGKPVTLETGAIINAPLFINEGDSVRVNTETGEYVER